MLSPRLSIIIPAYNEASRIETSLRRVAAYLAGKPWSAEIIVVADGCMDDTSPVARRAAESIPRLTVLDNDRNRGKGYSVRRGMLEGRGDVLLFSDADLSTPIEEADRLITAIERGHDVAIGSRALPASDVRVRQPWWRQSMGRAFNWFARRAGLADILDTQCGFKAFRRDAGRRIFALQRVDRYAFDVEVLWIARRLGLRIAEIPVAWVNHPESRVHPIRDASRMLIDLARIRLHDARGVYRP